MDVTDLQRIEDSFKVLRNDKNFIDRMEKLN